MTYEEQQKRLRGLVPQGTAGATELQNQGFNDVSSLVNNEMLNNNQDPFNLDGQDEGTLQNILKAIEGSFNKPQTSALDILKQSREASGIPALQENLINIQKLIGQKTTGFEQASNVLSEQLAPQPFITGQQAALERRAQTELSGLTRQQQALTSQLGFAQEQAGGEATARQADITRAEERPGKFLDLISKVFGIKQGQAQERRAEKAETRANTDQAIKIYEFQRDQELDPLKKQKIEADIALTRANIKETEAQTKKINNEVSQALSTNTTLRGAITGLPVGQQDGAFGAIASFKNARDIIELLDKGVETGPISGRLRQGLKIFGLPITPSGQSLGLTGENFNKFAAATTAFTANYIKALSGVQVSDREREFLMTALPSPNNQESVNRANVSMLLQFLKNKYELQLGLPFDQFADEIPQVGSSGINQYIKSLGL
mgnify:CR=1 FL=1